MSIEPEPDAASQGAVIEVPRVEEVEPASAPCARKESERPDKELGLEVGQKRLGVELSA